MHTQNGYSHQHQEHGHESLEQRFMAHELDATEFAREIFGDPAETPAGYQATLIRQADEAEAGRETDDTELQ